VAATVSNPNTLSRDTAAAILLNKATVKVATTSNSNIPSRATHNTRLKTKALALLVVKTPSARPSKVASNMAKPAANTEHTMPATLKAIPAITAKTNNSSQATAATTPTRKTKRISNNWAKEVNRAGNDFPTPASINSQLSRPTPMLPTTIPMLLP